MLPLFQMSLTDNLGRLDDFGLKFFKVSDKSLAFFGKTGTVECKCVVTDKCILSCHNL